MSPTIDGEDIVRCPNGHRLMRWDTEPCRSHGSHRVYTCPMFRGAGRCERTVVVPPLGPACTSGGER